MFPSPNLGLSLKYKSELANNYAVGKFPSPNLGLSLKYCPPKGDIADYFGFRPLIWGYL